MDRTEFQIDGLNIYHFRASPANYAILILHGTGGHGGCYDTYGFAHATLGADVYAMDLPGHGRSRGRHGFWSMTDCLSSIDIVAAHIKTTTGLPVFLLGSSQGSAFAYYALNTSDSVAGSITMGLAAFHLSPFKDAIAPLKSKEFDKMSKFFRNSLQIDLKKFLNIESDYGSPEVTQRLLADPDMTWVYDLNSYRDLLIFEPDVKASENKRPMLVTVGENDRFMPPHYVKKLVDQIGGPVTFCEFKGAPHQLMLERTSEFCQTVDSWVQSILQTSQKAIAGGISFAK
ncbi:MAG: alpha-beta hydrolase superfamily lysophospholipase [Oceanicoccus sp.]|jgi:alpha-beta hydrolase superfamily lysophospholipase